jgi:hypothetical protein
MGTPIPWPSPLLHGCGGFFFCLPSQIMHWGAYDYLTYWDSYFIPVLPWNHPLFLSLENRGPWSPSDVGNRRVLLMAGVKVIVVIGRGFRGWGKGLIWVSFLKKYEAPRSLA